MGARYGQHFLRNRRAVETILARFDPRAEDRVVEIGPGRGALTAALVQRAGALAAVEIDPGLAESLARFLDIPHLIGRARTGRRAAVDPAAGRHDALQTSFSSGSADTLPSSLAAASSSSPAGAVRGAADTTRRGPSFVLEADALHIRYADLARLLGAGEEARLRVIGNLPYSVATALVRRMIAERHRIDDALFMVQKEVADRLLALPRTKPYGYLSVLLALTAERERVLTLEPGSFSPPPKVRSTVVALRFRRPERGFAEEDARMDALLRAAFSERRKKLAGNLAKHYGLDRPEVAGRLASCEVDPNARAEELPPETFTRLAAALPDPQNILRE